MAFFCTLALVIFIATHHENTIRNKNMNTKKNFGINLKGVTCPKCGLEQPNVRIPKSWKEAIWGRYTCSNCGCKMDKYGKEREE